MIHWYYEIQQIMPAPGWTCCVGVIGDDNKLEMYDLPVIGWAVVKQGHITTEGKRLGRGDEDTIVDLLVLEDGRPTLTKDSEADMCAAADFEFVPPGQEMNPERVARLEARARRSKKLTEKG